jgi:hypothetical protein
MNDTKVKLISSDNVENIVDYKIAIQSNTLALFLSPEINDKYSISSGVYNLNYLSDTDEIRLPIKNKYLKRILDFMQYKQSFSSMEFQIKDEETLELLEIASYLKI